jgi:serine/threonine protein kinase/tetratricopeptide (TPR) repeat protein/TolB-like protein
MPFECPVCQTSNPDSSAACGKCATPNPFLTNLDDAGNRTVAASFADANALSGGRTTPLDTAIGSRASAAAARARSTSGATLFPGAVLAGRYEILKMLGEGGMGTVYKAKDQELDRLVALKVIRPEYANHQETIRRFKQELILARQVTHRNVIRIFDLGIADNLKFITMDFVEGRDLSKIISERGKFPLREACDIVRQICSGLDAAHAEGVVHRDLKPQNIMLDAQGRVFLMDFGLARSTELVGMTRTGALIGTPTYMSPEQARGEKADARTDIFALGVIFYELITGKRPYKDEPMMATLVRRTKELATAPSQVDSAVPQSVSEIVMKCLQIKTDLRYQNVSDILHDLDLILPSQSSGSQSASARGAAQALSSGSFFGPRYRIESLLGEGGMGKVYKAQDGELRRTVALKLVRPELASDPDSMDRLKQEILLASRVSHKNILRIHDLGDVGGLKFISMAYVDGKDLHQIIAADGKLPVPRAVRIARQLCLALEAAHSEGVVHRDLKPQNVLVDHEDQVYVSDFGLAKSLEAHNSAATQAGEVNGTPRYMSPEQVESGVVDNRSDLYALGLILYEMVTADLPFQSESVLQAMYQRVTQSPKSPKELNPDLPDSLVNVIMRCLEKDPAQRYQHARDILVDLERADSAPQSPTVAPVAAPPRWRKTALLAAAAAMLLAAGISLSVPKFRQTLFGGNRASTSAPVGAKYLAVLPLRIDDPSLQYTADGIVDSLSAKLFQLKDVHLASPAAAAKVNLKDPPNQIARSLGAKLLVQGSLQASGDRIAVIVNLDEPSTGKRLWSKEFSGLKQDLLTLQDQIYSGVETALDLKVTNEERARSATRLTGNASAYELYLKGQSLIKNGQRDDKTLKDALDLFQSATQKDPSFALAYTGIADTAIHLYNINKDTARIDQALTAATRAKALNDNLPEVHSILGSVYTATGRNAEAVAELKRALELAPNSDEGYLRLGRLYMNSGQKAEALRALQQAVDANPFYWFNLNLLGSAYLQFGENEKALKAFQRVTELQPNNVQGWNNVAIMEYRQGKWNESIAALKKVLDLKPSATVYANLGTSYFFLGQYEDARMNFEKAVEMSPQVPQRVGFLADCYRALGDHDKASVTYQRAISLGLSALETNPRDSVTLSYLALFYAKMGDEAKGLEFIRRAREIDPSNIDFLYKEAQINAIANRIPEALKSLREALSKGYSVREAFADPDLKGIRQTKEFLPMIKQFEPKSGS